MIRSNLILSKNFVVEYKSVHVCKLSKVRSSNLKSFKIIIKKI